MAKVVVSEREVKPAVPAVVEKTYTLTMTENEAKGMLAITGRLACQNHPNSLGNVYRALHGHFGYDASPQIIVTKGGERISAGIKFAD